MKENQKKPEEILAKYLDCPCRIFEPMKDDSLLMEAYTEAAERGKKEGFVPVLVCCETILETLVWNSEGASDETDYGFNIEAVRTFREEMCKKELPEGKAVLKEFGKQYEDSEDEYEEEDDDYEEWEDDEEYEEDDEEYEEDEEEYEEEDDDYEEDDEDYYDDDEDDEYGDEYEDWEKECLRLMAEEEDDEDEYDDDNTFSAYISYDGVNATTTVVLAEIPVTHPWEVFAWLPFGGWNECPCTEDLMAVSKYWYEAYGAVPATVSHDVLEYVVPEPVKKKDAKELAEEMGVFCSDIILQGVGDVRILANILTESTVWYFWWD